jgi:LytTr DNA-binding domain
MPLATPILGAARSRGNARFANRARNFVDRAGARLPGFAWLSAGAIAAAILMIVVGGLGTWAMPIAMRTGFWALLMGWNAIKWQTWFALLVRNHGDWRRAAIIGAAVLNLSLPFEIKASLALCGSGGAMAPATTIWVEALAISGVLFALLFLVRWRMSGAHEAAPPAPAMNPDGLLARAGLACPTALVAIVAEDHYCRVYLRDGASALVHHRFRDALEEVAGLDGLRVHRGAWVADAAVAAASREGRRWLLALADGRRIAVSARYVAAVRGRGWLRRRA